MIKAVFSLLREKHSFFLNLLWEHFFICAITIFIAAVVGLCLGILISEKRKASGLVLGTTNILYTIPSISMLGILIPITGIGNKTAIIALTVYALLPMVRNTYAGLCNVDADILEAAKGMGSTPWQVMVKIKLPLALPVIMAGLRNMVVMTIALAGIASFIGAGGLGVAIYRGITTNNMALTVAGSLLIALLAFAGDLFFGWMEKLAKKRMSLVALILAALFLITAAVGLSGNRERSIHIATKPMTEQLILGEMLKLLIEDRTNLSVSLTQGVGGGTANIHPAMVSGEFDLYPEYTGTGWSYVLKREGLPEEAELYRQLVEGYRREYQLEWVGLYGFNNTYGLAVRQDVARQYGLKTYSDLAAVSSKLVFGGEYDFFEREDGYQALCQEYGLYFQKQVDMDIGLKYSAMENGQIDVINVFTTDGQLSTASVVLLEDDRQFYPTYYCGTVIRQETLENYPELTAVLELMEDLIQDGDMARMNYEVESGQDEKAVALAFLQERGLIQ